jgi:hypothetical protein
MFRARDEIFVARGRCGGGTGFTICVALKFLLKRCGFASRARRASAILRPQGCA